MSALSHGILQKDDFYKTAAKCKKIDILFKQQQLALARSHSERVVIKTENENENERIECEEIQSETLDL